VEKYAGTAHYDDFKGLHARIVKRKADLERAEGKARALATLLKTASDAERAGEYDKAAKAYESALRLEDAPRTRELLRSARYQHHMKMSAAEEKAGRLAAAVAAVDRAIAAKPTPRAQQRRGTLVRLQRFTEAWADAQKLEGDGKLAEARDRLARALESAPAARRAEVQKALARVEKALAEVEAKKELDEVHRLVKRGDLAGAHKRAEAGAATYRGTSVGGEFASLRGRIGKLIADAQKALTSTPVRPGSTDTRPLREVPRRIVKGPLGMSFAFVPAGEYRVGDRAGQDDEKPVHAVRLGAYYIGVHEVTNAQYRRFDPRHRASAYSRGPAQPVVGVSWGDAVRFCSWLSRRARATCRLPTEAEWEVAARGLDARRFPWGDAAVDAGSVFRANVGGRDEASRARDGFVHTATVGSFPEGVSAFGCRDMTGNVWEWCLDWYDAGYYAKGAAVDPRGPKRGRKRVVRGGSWFHSAALGRCSNRHSLDPRSKEPSVGFRIVREARPGEQDDSKQE
jgi:formylglycine-generating enzyme required for sulfatase activity